MTASFDRRRWWHSFVGWDILEPDIDLDRPEWVGSRRRRPGETLEAACNARLLQMAFGFGLALLMPMGVLVGYYAPTCPMFFALLFFVPGAFVIFWNARKLRPLVRGYWTERLVGEYLDGLERNGLRVLHDVPFEGFNVDHLVVSTRGFYVIETKGIRPPRSGRLAPIVYRSGSLTIGGKPLVGDPIAQVRSASTTVQKLVRSLGSDLPVRGVVLFPGRYIEGRPSAPADPWVLTPKGFPTWLSNERDVTSAEHVRDVYNALRARYH